MHAFLLIGDRGKNKKIKEISGKDISGLISIDLKKINDVRELQSLTKYESQNEKYYLLNDFQNATTEAMNAFLKILEEPNENINFILCATEDKNILETITSRCRIVRLGYEEDSENIKFAEKFLKADINKKLELLHSISGKDDALDFLSKLIEGCHPIMLRKGGDSEKIAQIIESSISAKREILGNANVSIALTKLTIDLV